MSHERRAEKVVQYLNEAEASERALVRVLQSQIAMTPRGSYRSALETHLDETRRHGDRVATRLQALDQGGDPLGAFVGVIETAFGQALALTKTPFDLLRGSGGEEKVLKNAKDACASEALEIATYTAIERLAQRVGDDETARLAASIRAEEERMLARVLRAIPRLTDAVVGAEVEGDSSYDVRTTGAADAGREVGRAARTKTTRTAARAKRTRARRARCRVSLGSRARSRAPSRRKGDLPIARYDKLTADEITRQAPGVLADRSGQDRRVRAQEPEPHHDPQPRDALRGDEPWAGYDELTAAEVIAVLSEGDDDRSQDGPLLRARATRTAPAS
jgi:ferritin-like metal-binding protein YciE